jgi:hypothetical protein
MPIAWRLDATHRLITAAGHGVLTDDDVFGYQREAWSRPEVLGYDELIDMTRVTEIVMPSRERVRDLAALAAAMDGAAPASRLAIVAPLNLAFGLGRMFQAYRELDPRSTKKVGVFRTLDEALAFLRLDHPVALPEI